MWISGPSGYVLTISDIFNEAFEDQVEGCDDEQFKIRSGQESWAHQVLF